MDDDKKGTIKAGTVVEVDGKKHIVTEQEIINLFSKSVIDMLISAKFAASKGEAKRLIQQNAIKLIYHDQIISVNDIDSAVVIPEDGVILKKGKHQFMKFIIKD